MIAVMNTISHNVLKLLMIEFMIHGIPPELKPASVYSFPRDTNRSRAFSVLHCLIPLQQLQHLAVQLVAPERLVVYVLPATVQNPERPP